MGVDVLKIILVRDIREDFLDMLNLLGKGDISKEPLDKIIDLCRRYSIGSYKTIEWEKGLEQDVFSRAQNSSKGGAIGEEIGKLIENISIKRMSSIS